MIKKRGRPPIYTTDEQRKAARAHIRHKFKSVSIDADLVEALNIIADSLEPEFGFRPTLSQSIRHAIKKMRTTS